MALIGVNCSGRGEESPAELAATGSTWVRAVAYPDADISEWLLQCRTRGLDVLLVIASESFAGFASQAEGLAYYSRKYGNLVHYWQIGNEADHESVSSWTLSKAKLNDLLAMARATMPSKTLIGPGLVSGDPSWLNGVHLASIDAIAVHPYGQRPWGTEADWPWMPGNFGQVGELIHRYAAYGKPIWITEIGINSRDVTEKQQAEYCGSIMAVLKDNPEIERAAWFAYHDFDKFGLVRDDGKKKPSYKTFQVAAGIVSGSLTADPGTPARDVIDASVTPPEVVVAPSPDPTPAPPENAPVWLTAADGRSVGPGVSRYILDNGLFPLQGEEYCAMDVSVTACAEGMVWWFARAQMCKLVRWSES